jgi:hypothetical protein
MTTQWLIFASAAGAAVVELLDELLEELQAAAPNRATTARAAQLTGRVIGIA